MSVIKELETHTITLLAIKNFNSHIVTKFLVNSLITHETHDNIFENNKFDNGVNKGKYRVQLCYFCEEESHKKFVNYPNLQLKLYLLESFAYIYILQNFILTFNNSN